jgi:transcriptional regulator with XRE-family HTH domain
MNYFDPYSLAECRRRKGKTQAVLARESGISQVSISAIEQGKKDPRLRTLTRLAHALGCSVDKFFVSR